jgi:uncharacterized protein
MYVIWYHHIQNKMLHRVEQCIGFERDDGNIEKKWLRHSVLSAECEEVFLNRPLLIADDANHSEPKSR